MQTGIQTITGTKIAVAVGILLLAGGVAAYAFVGFPTKSRSPLSSPLTGTKKNNPRKLQDYIKKPIPKSISEKVVPQKNKR